MCKAILNLIGFVTAILTIIYLFRVYHDTEIDIFQQEFQIGEKEKFFIDPTVNPYQILKEDLKCKSYESLIMDPKTKKLGDVFHLNFDAINYRASLMVVLYITVFIFIVFSVLYAIIIAFVPILTDICTIFFVLFSMVVYFAMAFLVFLFIMIIYSYYAGDTKTYVDFLSCKNVNYEGFRRYRTVENFKSNFTRFMWYYITSVLIGFITNSGKDSQ
jgi:hypothetical protein